MPYIIALILGYLLGCSNMALYTAKARGVDMRAGGSRNLGAINSLLLMGWKAGILVCIHDIGKAVLAVIVSQRLFPHLPLIGHVAGTACILGHIFPFYLKFKGGKGYASYLGTMLALDWAFTLLVVLCAAALAWITDYIVAGSAATVLAYPIYLGFTTADWRPVLIVSLASAVVLYKHRENFVKIANGTEPRVRAFFVNKRDTADR